MASIRDGNGSVARFRIGYDHGSDRDLAPTPLGVVAPLSFIIPELLPGWIFRLTEPIAPFYFEPVAAFYLTDRITLLLSPLNILMGLVLGGLVALNLVVAVDAYRHARACRRRALGGLLGSLPGFLTGFACCVPTVALVLGAQFTLALIALRSWFFPVAVVAMSASLVWNLHSLARDRQSAAQVSVSV
ncbi:MAG: hypothetical protein GEU79_01280 [Acidimicrobiia bacterium]|nr:hypothetical protein [Acidimicrobiia bacterium]